MAKLRLPKVGGKAAAKVSASSSGYSATGVAAPAQGSGLEAGSAIGTKIQDIVPELTSPYSRLVAYTKMMYDAGVDVSMRAAKTPVLGAEFYVEPYGDSQMDEDVAYFIRDNLFGGMSSPFVNVLEDILHMYEDGFSVIEKVVEERQWTPPRTGGNGKTYTMLKKLSPRPASTISKINYDNNGGPVEVLQSAIQADGTTKDVKLDIANVMIFTFGRRGGDLTGRSLLRTAYMHWYYKTELYKIDAIQKERHSLGIPRGKLLAGYKASDKSILRTLLRNIRTNEEAFVMQVPNVEIDFMELPANIVNVLESAEHHNNMILLNVMAQFLALGLHTSGGGGRATAGQGQDIFMKALRYVANYIADVINMYLIPELVVWNFPTTNFPKLCVRNIGEARDLQMMAGALGNLFSQGAITPDRETENYTRKLFDFPAKLESEPAIDPNARQQAAVTLYDAQGNAIKAIPVDPNAATSATSANGNGNGNGNGATPPQKGNVKVTPGNAGNAGKPPGAAS